VLLAAPRYQHGAVSLFKSRKNRSSAAKKQANPTLLSNPIGHFRSRRR
jgi:hypothetical protein